MRKEQSTGGDSAPRSALGLQVVRDLGELRVEAGRTVLAPARWRLANLFGHRRRALGQQTAALVLGKVFGVVTTATRLEARLFRPDFSRLAPEQILKLKQLLADNVDVRELVGIFGGQVWDYGLLGTRSFTTVGAGFVVDAFQNLVEVENMKYHGFGTGVGAEAVGNTALGTELTTQYASDNVRPTGTTTEGASGNIYRTVATLSPDSGGTLAITEHGIFDQASNAGGVLLDRTVFSAVNVVAGSDSLQATYELTFNTGS